MQKRAICILNILILLANCCWLGWNVYQQRSKETTNTWFLDARLALLERMRGEGQIESLDKALELTRAAQATPPSQLTGQDILELEGIYQEALSDWSVQLLLREEHVPLLPTFSEDQARQLLLAELYVLRANSKVLPEQESIAEAIMMHEVAIELLDSRELTLSMFLECLRVGGLENAKATKALVEKLEMMDGPRA